MENDVKKELPEQYLLFTLHDQVFALVSDNIIEIVQKNAITELPEKPDYVLGIVDLRGRVVPIIDAGLRVKGRPIAGTNRNCVIIVDKGDDLHVGLLVDDVVSVEDIEAGQINEPPAFGRSCGEARPYIRGITKVDSRLVLILDCSETLAEIAMSELLAQQG